MRERSTLCKRRQHRATTLASAVIADEKYSMHASWLFFLKFCIHFSMLVFVPCARHQCAGLFVLAELTAAAQLLGYSAFDAKQHRGQAVCLEFLCLVVPLLIALLQPESAVLLVTFLLGIAVALQYWTKSTLRKRSLSNTDAERQQCTSVRSSVFVMQRYNTVVLFLSRQHPLSLQAYDVASKSAHVQRRTSHLLHSTEST
jgi:hypothetical protein